LAINHRAFRQARILAMRIVAVDWSGKLKRAEEFLWLAEVRDRHLVDLRSGLSRPELVARLIEMAHEDAQMVVGLDFAFSFPRWWCVKRGWSTGREVWSGVDAEGEHLLATCEPPLWGQPGKPNPTRRNNSSGARISRTASAVRSLCFRSAAPSPSAPAQFEGCPTS
jgi:hypothetical protein